MQLERLKSAFGALPSDEERLSYLMELGREVPAAARDEANIVEGCSSKVWAEMAIEGGAVRLRFSSDSRIVAGLLHIVRSIYEGAPVAEAARIDAEAVFDALGLLALVSAARQAGVKAVVDKIRKFATTQSGGK